MEKKENKISMATPWSSSSKPGINCASTSLEEESTKFFIKERTDVHKLFIIEQEKTKRLSLILGVILILAGSALFIYAPAGKEKLSYIIGAVLMVFAAGAVGYKRIWGKIPFTEFKADQDKEE